MTAIPTPFGTQAGKYPFMGSMSLVNCYVEMQGEGTKAKYVIVPSEGMVTFSAVTDTPLRGAIFMEDLNVAYACFSSSVYKITSAGVATRIGTIPGTDQVRMTRNTSDPPQITVHANVATFYIESDVVTRIDDEDLPDDIVSVETLGEFTLYLGQDGRVTYSTQGDTSTIDALDFFTAEQSPDRGVEIKVDRGEILVFGSVTTDVFRFAGNDVDEPFVFRTSIQRGCLAEHSVQSCDGTLMFVGQSKEGEKGVYRLEGYNPRKISTPEIDRLIEGEADPSLIKAFSYGRAGHAFYVLKGTDWTRAYDAATQQWHSRKSYGLDVWRAQHCFAAWNKIIVGDQETGSLYYLADDTFTENSGVMVMEITSPFLHAFPNGGVVDRASFDLLVGQGVTSPTAQGYNPLAMISKSVDGGNTWSFPRHVSLGRQGRYKTRINEWRWGRFGPKGIAFRIAISDPVGRGLALMDAKVRPIAA
jgi:hypothetical protein